MVGDLKTTQISGGSGAQRGPVLAVLLTFVTLGLGQVYSGKPLKGFALFVGYFSGFVLAGWLGLLETFRGLVLFIGVAICVLGYVLVDAYRQARAAGNNPIAAHHRWGLCAVLVLLAWFVVPAAVRSLGVKPYRIPGGSMEPTIQVGDHIYVGLNAYRDKEPARGEIVAYHIPKDPQREFMHRIIGLPGDHLRIEEKRVYVNGELLEEPYVTFLFLPHVQEQDPRRDTMAEIAVPAGHYFTMGDNRDNTHDGRFWGFLPRELIVGKALYVYWSRNLLRIGTSFTGVPHRQESESADPP